MYTVLELGEDDLLVLALKEASIETMSQLLSMRDEDIDSLMVTTDDGNEKIVPLGKRTYIKV